MEGHRLSVGWNQGEDLPHIIFLKDKLFFRISFKFNNLSYISKSRNPDFLNETRRLCNISPFRIVYFSDMEKFLQKLSFIKQNPVVSVTIIFVVICITMTLAISFFAIKNTVINFKYRDICPDYFASLEAYVVGPDGKGLDSVSVTMRDNSNINLIYRTFTDSTGRFMLFNDFNTFALYETPFTYYLFVALNGNQDTVRYKFRRYRVCHFEKLEGPDTIIFDPFKNSNVNLALHEPSNVSLSSVTDDTPYERIALLSTKPGFISRSVEGWEKVLYGSILIGDKRIGVAAVKNHQNNPEYSRFSVYYIIDRNGNSDLSDDQVSFWQVNDDGSEADCSVRDCFSEDSIVINGSAVRLQIKLRGFGTDNPVLDYRNNSIIQGYYSLTGKKIKALLWDRGMTGFRERSGIRIGLDLDGNGNVDFREGSSEMFENATQAIVIDTLTFRIDSILNNGITVRGRRLYGGSVKRTSVSVGDMVPRVEGYFLQKFNLWKECSANDIVALYFFEGDSKLNMKDRNLLSFIESAGLYYKRISLVGINRRTSGEPYTELPVIEENLGWDGPMVRALHNHRDRELICVDSTGVIVCRGVPGNDLFKQFLEKTGAGAEKASSTSRVR